MQTSRWTMTLLLALSACSSSAEVPAGGGRASGSVASASSGSGPASSASSGGGTSSASASAGSGASAASGGGGGSGNPLQAPVILSFVATPPTLPQGGGQTTLNYDVQNADSLSIDQGVGVVTGTSKSVAVTGTTIFTLTATNANGSSTASTAVVTGQNPSSAPGRFTAMISPTSGESFVAPATLRLVAVGYDENVYTNAPTPGLGTNAAQLQFFVDDANVLTIDGANAEYDIFKGFTSGIATGQHTVWARATYPALGSSPAVVLDSEPRLITVTDPPAYGSTVDLTADVTLGDAAYALTGTAASRVRLNGHGFKITSNGATAAGALTLAFVDVYDLGNETDTAQPGIDVATTGAVTIEDSTFDGSNPVKLSINGSASASIRRNLFRSNMRMPIGQSPDGNTPGPSFGVMHLDGDGTGAKVFAGNNVGAGWVEFVNTQGWIIGGATDADSNVLIGPRVGIYVTGSNAMQVRRNYSHHVYYGGWSQGSNFELEGTTMSTIEHNVVYGSSWPVRGCSAGCQFQYNLVLEAGHEWMQPNEGASVHHNIFVGGDNDQGGFYAYNDPPAPDAANIAVYNNTFDGQLGKEMSTALLTDATTGPMTFTSNAFLNVPRAPTLTINAGSFTADYNGFFNPQTANYSDGRTPAHDVSGGDAKLGSPPSDISIDEQPVWLRSTTAANILSEYRTYYTPASGSPLIDAGDPQGGAGNDIGAVGAGVANSADRFGLP